MSEINRKLVTLLLFSLFYLVHGFNVTVSNENWLTSTNIVLDGEWKLTLKVHGLTSLSVPNPTVKEVTNVAVKKNRRVNQLKLFINKGKNLCCTLRESTKLSIF